MLKAVTAWACTFFLFGVGAWLWDAPRPSGGEEWAAWVQAFGSMLAIVASAMLAIWVADRQSRDAHALLEKQKELTVHAETVQLIVNTTSSVMRLQTCCAASRKNIWSARTTDVIRDEMRSFVTRLEAVNSGHLPEPVMAAHVLCIVGQLRSAVAILTYIDDKPADADMAMDLFDTCYVDAVKSHSALLDTADKHRIGWSGVRFSGNIDNDIAEMLPAYAMMSSG